MTKKYLKIIIFVAIVFCVSGAKAQVFDVPDESQPEEAGVNLKIMPSVVEEVIDPGGEAERSFWVENSSDIPLPIKSYVRGFGASDEVGGVYIEDDVLVDKDRKSVV